jgi:hypothetical protein
MEKEKKEFGLEKSYKIPLETAAKLIYAFLNQPILYKIASKEAIGGTINKNVFNQGGGLIYYGSMGWYCRNLNGGEYPKFFLAFEDGEYDPENVPKKPKNKELYYPKHTFTFDKEVFTETDVFNMLINDQFPLQGECKIQKNQVLKFLENKPLDHFGKKFNKYNCSFFENNKVQDEDVSDFLKIKDMEAIRYYFGYYEGDLPHSLSNRIRIILIAVDKTGKNIAPENILTIDSNFLLQNSWPPPPPIR